MNQRARRPLRWGPFSVGAAVTLCVAAVTLWACASSYGHWWFWPASIISSLLVAVLAASAVSALTSPPREGQR